jgi:hypothetical protein
MLSLAASASLFRQLASPKYNGYYPAEGVNLQDQRSFIATTTTSLDVPPPAGSVGATSRFYPIKSTMNTSSSVLIRYSMVGLCVVLACVAPAHAASEETAGGIQQMMSPGEFKAAGLNKLSPEELQKLTAWLQGYREVAEKKATERAAKVEHTKLDMLVSRVDGTFNGLTGRTVIRLEDGTVWKQANAEDRHRPKVTDHPAAVVIHGIFGYKMQVEGTQEFYVDPVRNP